MNAFAFGDMGQAQDIQNPLIVSNGLVGCWSLNEGAGAIAYDSSGNGYTGSLLGSPAPTWVDARVGSGLLFNGSSGYVYFGRPSVFNLSSFTFAAWVNPNTINSIQSVIDCNNQANNGWVLNLNQNGATGGQLNGYVALYAYMGGTFNNPAYSNGAVLRIGQWTHFAVTWGGGNLTLYVNGSTSNTTNRTGQSAIGYNSNVFTFGRDIFSGGGQYFNGVLDDVRVYNRVLSNSEITALAISSKNPPLLNPSFETPAQSVGGYTYAPAGNAWNMGGTCGISYQSNTWVGGNAADGVQCAWIQTAGSMYQSIVTTPGTTYNVYVQASARPSYVGNVWGMFLDGVTLSGPNAMNTANQWFPFTGSFTATTTAHTLTFSASNPLGGDRSVLLDHIRIVPV